MLFLFKFLQALFFIILCNVVPAKTTSTKKIPNLITKQKSLSKNLINKTSSKLDQVIKSTKSNVHNTKTKQLANLTSFFDSHKALDIHNKALEFLQTNQQQEALFLLKKNLYHNFFIPSYIKLFKLDSPVFLYSFFWHGLLACLACLCLIYLALALKNPKSSYFKLGTFVLSLQISLFVLGYFMLKPRGMLLYEINLKSSPFAFATEQASLPKGTQFVFLNQTKHWARIQSSDKQQGWVKKQDIFQVF